MFSKRDKKLIIKVILYYLLNYINIMIHINDDKGIYIGEEPKQDIKYYGKIYYKNGSSYQGYFLNRKKNGYGEEKNNDDYHKGFYQNDKLHGKCISYIKSKNNNTDGYYQDSLLNGECLFYDEKSTLVNKGMFKNGKSCVATYEIIYKQLNGKSEKIYEGFVYEDKYNGFGKLYENGKVYIGNFTTGRKDGKFIVCDNNGNLIYSYQSSNIEIMIDIEKINKDNFNNYKNTVIFNNDMFDDDHKIIYKENNIVKYIGKFNSDLQFNDDSGNFYEGSSAYTGKFENGKFISGIYTFNGGKYKGDFNGLNLTGNGTIEFINGDKFIGEFLNNISTGKLYFKQENINMEINCKVIVYDNNISIESIPNNELINGEDKYVGNFKILRVNNSCKVVLDEGKHYQNNVLIYEGDFKKFKYNGIGTKYHNNGNIMATGVFEENEPFKAEYYDENGNLIYTDNNDENYDMPPLISQMINTGIINTPITNILQNNNGTNNIINTLLNNVNNILNNNNNN